MNNKTKCMLTITLNENSYTHQKDYSTEVTLIDYNLEHPSFANECNLVVAPGRKKDDMKKDEITLVLFERKETALITNKVYIMKINNLICFITTDSNDYKIILISIVLIFIHSFISFIYQYMMESLMIEEH